MCILSADPVRIHPLDGAEAKAVGQLCGATGTADVVDASVALVTRLVGGVAVTNDPEDLRRLDPTLDLVRC